MAQESHPGDSLSTGQMPYPLDYFSDPRNLVTLHKCCVVVLSSRDSDLISPMLSESPGDQISYFFLIHRFFFSMGNHV